MRPPPKRTETERPAGEPAAPPVVHRSGETAPPLVHPHEIDAEPGRRARRRLPAGRLLWSASSGLGASVVLHAALAITLGLWMIVAELRTPRLEVTAWHTRTVSEEELEHFEVEEEIEVSQEEIQPEVDQLAQQEALQVDLSAAQGATASMVYDGPLSAIGLEHALPGDVVGSLGLAAEGAGRGTGGGLLDANASFDDIVYYVKRHGLDIVLLFDSTGSMGGEIDAVKARIGHIGGILLKKVPSARISLVTYRDRGDEYVVRGLPLTGDLDEVQRALAVVKADGGGDAPEGVLYGLKWAIANNTFRKAARKVILLFGDAPPHIEHVPATLAAANQFHRYQRGVVSTVTCRNIRPLPPFVQIAQAAGGESFLLADQQRLMEALVVLIFGSKHREKVAEFFELDGPGPGMNLAAPGMRPPRGTVKRRARR